VLAGSVCVENAEAELKEAQPTPAFSKAAVFPYAISTAGRICFYNVGGDGNSLKLPASAIR
jgi:hypothetical protein